MIVIGFYDHHFDSNSSSNSDESHYSSSDDEFSDQKVRLRARAERAMKAEELKKQKQSNNSSEKPMTEKRMIRQKIAEYTGAPDPGTESEQSEHTETEDKFV